MANLLHDMKALMLQNRTVGLVENGSWAPVSGKLIRAELEGLKGFQVLEPVASLKSALKGDSMEQLGPAEGQHPGFPAGLSFHILCIKRAARRFSDRRAAFAVSRFRSAERRISRR